MDNEDPLTESVVILDTHRREHRLTFDAPRRLKARLDEIEARLAPRD